MHEHKKKILVVDDNEANCRFLDVLLSKTYHITTVLSGREAVTVLENGLHADLILLDIIMPDMDGLDVCKVLSQNSETKEIPVIFVTSKTDDDTLEKAFKAGGYDYVRKPVNILELQVRIKSAIKQKELVENTLKDEKMNTILEMAGTVCHELNQPMQAIAGYAELIAMDIEPGHPAYESVEIIQEQVSKMGKITQKLMDITQHQTKKYSDLTTIIDLDKSSKPD